MREETKGLLQIGGIVLVLGIMAQWFNIWRFNDASSAGKAFAGEEKVNTTPVLSLGEYGKGKNAKTCPICGMSLEGGQGMEVVLSNSKRIMIGCWDCKDEVEADRERYWAFMY